MDGGPHFLYADNRIMEFRILLEYISTKNLDMSAENKQLNDLLAIINMLYSEKERERGLKGVAHLSIIISRIV